MNLNSKLFIHFLFIYYVECIRLLHLICFMKAAVCSLPACLLLNDIHMD